MATTLEILETIVTRASCAPHDDEERANQEFTRIMELARGAIKQEKEAREYEEKRAREAEDRIANARQQAVAQMESICEMVAALECDYERLEELREERKPWTAGWNVPGYLPDSEPCGCESFNDARDYIADELEQAADNLDIEPDADDAAKVSELRELAAAFRASTEQEISQQAADGLVYWIARAEHDGLSESDAEELAELETAAGDCTSQDEARETIEQDALSVEIRSGWYTPGQEPEPEEFTILLCTGGPAVRIIGELDQHKQPDRARIEYQDWFTPWTELVDGVDHDALLKYCQVFYFGE